MKYSVFILALSVSLLACKKDSSSSTSNTDQISSADWKYDTGGIGDANGNIISPFPSGTIPACTLDNTIHFNANGTGTVAENANVCPGASATSTFTWSFLNNETVLNVSAGAVAGIGGSFKIKQLTSTQFTLLKDTTVSGFAATAVVQLKH
ncbi:MAG: hypothetical protein ACXVBF_09285 [Flavisolibacter sp.]